MFWIIGFVVVLASVVAGYLLPRHEQGPKAAVRDLPRGVLMLLFVVIAIVIFVIILRFVGFSVSETFRIAGMWTALGYLILSKWQAGPVLLNLDRSGMNTVFLFFAGVWMLFLIGDMASLVLEPDAEFDLSKWLSLTGLPLFLYLGFSRLQIREAGILKDERFLKWERIESYEWKAKALTVKVKKGFPRTVRYRVPRQHRDAVNNLFAQHVSRATDIKSDNPEIGHES